MKVTKNTSLEESFSQEKWLQYLNTFQDNFNQEKAQMASNDITIFSEKYKEICQKEKDIKEILDEFQIVKREIAKNGGVNEDAIRLEERDKEPYGLKCSSVTLAQLKKNKLDIKISELMYRILLCRCCMQPSCAGTCTLTWPSRRAPSKSSTACPRSSTS